MTKRLRIVFRDGTVTNCWLRNTGVIWISCWSHHSVKHFFQKCNFYIIYSSCSRRRKALFRVVLFLAVCLSIYTIISPAWFEGRHIDQSTMKCNSIYYSRKAIYSEFNVSTEFIYNRKENYIVSLNAWHNTKREQYMFMSNV